MDFGETGMVLGTGKERPLPAGCEAGSYPEARFESASLHQVQVYALTMPLSLMFQQTFSRKIDADDYETFWRGLGQCHIRRTRK